MKEKLNIALVAHDSRKAELLDWCFYNRRELALHNLYATGTTGSLLKRQFLNLYESTLEEGFLYAAENLHCLRSGPLGGDSMIGAMIANQQIDALIFFCDNLIVQGHNADIQGLTRLASLYNIAFATNRTTADMILTSSLLKSKEYEPILPACIANYQNRTLDLNEK